MGAIWERRENLTGWWLAILIFALVMTGCGNSISDPFFTPQVTLSSLDISPPNSILVLGSDQQFRVQASFSDGNTVDLRSNIVWSSSEPTVATINANGLATSVSEGRTIITASSQGISISAVLTVTDAELVSLSVTCATPTIADGTRANLTATGTLTDGREVDLTSSADWISSGPSVALIESPGVALGADPGQATITATVGDVSGTFELTVSDAAVVSIEVSLAPPETQAEADLGGELALRAIATLTDGTLQDVTQSANWTSFDIATLTVFNLTPGRGVVSGIAEGTALVTASLLANDQTFSDSLEVTVVERPQVVVGPGGFFLNTDTGILSQEADGDGSQIAGWDPLLHRVRATSFRLTSSLVIAGSRPLRVRAVQDIELSGSLNGPAVPPSEAPGNGRDGQEMEFIAGGNLTLSSGINSAGASGLSGGFPGGGNGGAGGLVRLVAGGNLTFNGGVNVFGGEGWSDNGSGGNGGRGGQVFLSCGQTLTFAGGIQAEGGNGGDSNSQGGGLGGEGGTVDFDASEIVFLGSVVANGGIGGDGNGAGGNGGGGGTIGLRSVGDLSVNSATLAVNGGRGGINNGGGGNGGLGGDVLLSAAAINTPGSFSLFGDGGAGGSANGDGGGNGGDGGSLALEVASSVSGVQFWMYARGGQGGSDNIGVTRAGGGNGGLGGQATASIRGNLTSVAGSGLSVPGGNGGARNTSTSFDGGGNGGNGGSLLFQVTGSLTNTGSQTITGGLGGANNGAGGGNLGANGTITP